MHTYLDRFASTDEIINVKITEKGIQQRCHITTVGHVHMKCSIMWLNAVNMHY